MIMRRYPVMTTQCRLNPVGFEGDGRNRPMYVNTSYTGMLVTQFDLISGAPDTID